MAFDVIRFHYVSLDASPLENGIKSSDFFKDYYISILIIFHKRIHFELYQCLHMWILEHRDTEILR